MADKKPDLAAKVAPPNNAAPAPSMNARPIPGANLRLPPGTSFARGKREAAGGFAVNRATAKRNEDLVARQSEQAFLASLTASSMRTGSIRAASEAAIGLAGDRDMEESGDGEGRGDGTLLAPRRRGSPSSSVGIMAEALRSESYRWLASEYTSTTGRCISAKEVEATITRDPRGRSLIAVYMHRRLEAVSRPRSRGVYTEQALLLLDYSAKRSSERQLLAFLIQKRGPRTVVMRR